MEQKRGRGRPKGSTKKPKVSPLVEKKVAPIANKEAVAVVNAENTNQHTEIVGSFDPSKPDEFYYDPFKNPQFRKKMGLKD